MSQTKPVFVNGKAKLDHCYLCNQNKAAIKYSQSRKDPIYCGSVDYFGECEWEADHHVFVITEKQWLAELEAEKEWFGAHELDWNDPFADKVDNI